MKEALLLLSIVFFFITPVASAHPGRTDSSGGHTCRTNCASWGLNTGEYHYHGGGTSGGGSSTGSSGNAAPVQTNVAPVVQTQQIIPTRAPIIPTSTPLPTATPTLTPVPTKYIETANDKKKLFKVVSVIDGDTIDMLIRGKVERVRLLGIDTPETKDPRKPVQCFGVEATKKLQLFIAGKFVKLVDDRQQGNLDKYNRLLRYVYLDNPQKTFVNGEMVKQGYAFSYKEYPTKFLEKLNEFERYAREHNLGLWGSCN